MIESMSPDQWTHVGGAGVIFILVVKTVMPYVMEWRGGNGGESKKIGDMHVESYEMKVRHIIRNEMTLVANSVREGNASNGQKLDSINANMIRLVAIMEERKK